MACRGCDVLAGDDCACDGPLCRFSGGPTCCCPCCPAPEPEPPAPECRPYSTWAERLACWWGGHRINHAAHRCSRCRRTCEDIAAELRALDLRHEYDEADWGAR